LRSPLGLGIVSDTMPKPNAKVLFRHATHYLKAHPEEVVRLVKGALGLRVGVPLDALRFLADELGRGKHAPKDVVLEAAPPGLRVAATVVAMGSTLRAALTLFVEELEVRADEARVTARIADMTLEVLDGEGTPIAGLVKSGALDLSKPGNLVAYMPQRPAVLVDAKDDRVVLDLLKAKQLADNERVRRLLSVVTPVLTVSAVRTRDDHLDIHLVASPSGVGDSIAAARSAS